MGGRPENTPEILWSKVDKKGPDECWEWKGFRNEQGYGRTWINDKGYYAHRVIFALANEGVIDRSAPKNRYAFGYIMHTCDNPPCCNPAHLRACTHGENIADKTAKGRNWTPKSTESPRAKLTADQVRTVRKLYASGVSFNEIAAFYKVSRSCIDHIIYRISYKDIE